MSASTLLALFARRRTVHSMLSQAALSSMANTTAKTTGIRRALDVANAGKDADKNDSLLHTHAPIAELKPRPWYV